MIRWRSRRLVHGLRKKKRNIQDKERNARNNKETDNIHTNIIVLVYNISHIKKRRAL